MKNIYDSTISESSSKLNLINLNDLDGKFKKINISVDDFNMITNLKKTLNIVGKYDLLYLFRDIKDIYLAGFLNTPTRSYYKLKTNDDVYKINDYYTSRKIKFQARSVGIAAKI